MTVNEFTTDNCLGNSWRRCVIRTEAWLAAKGFKTVHLLVERLHLPAIKTYLKAGYEIMGRCSMYGHEYYACEKILPASTET